jgi:hypothetical protein
VDNDYCIDTLSQSDPLKPAALDQVLAEDYASGGPSDSLLPVLADELMLVV